MATAELVESMLNSFVMAYGGLFPLTDGNRDSLVKLWTDRLYDFPDSVVEDAACRVLDELKKPPTPADVREYCVNLMPRPSFEPTQALELPTRDPGEVAEAKALKRYILSRDDLKAQVDEAKKGMLALLDELTKARTADDAERIHRAEAAIRSATSPEAYEKARRRWVEKATGKPAPVLVMRRACPGCNGAGIVKVYRPHGQTPGGAYILVDQRQSETGYWLVYCHCQTAAGRHEREEGEQQGVPA